MKNGTDIRMGYETKRTFLVGPRLLAMQKGVQASWEAFEGKIGRLWMPKILKGKTIT